VCRGRSDTAQSALPGNSTAGTAHWAASTALPADIRQRPAVPYAQPATTCARLAKNTLAVVAQRQGSALPAQRVGTRRLLGLTAALHARLVTSVALASLFAPRAPSQDTNLSQSKGRANRVITVARTDISTKFAAEATLESVWRAHKVPPRREAAKVSASSALQDGTSQARQARIVLRARQEQRLLITA